MAAGQWKILWKSQNLPLCKGLKHLSNDCFEFPTQKPQAKQEQEQELCSSLEIIRRLQNWWIVSIFSVQASASQIWWLWHLWELLELVLNSNLLKEAPEKRIIHKLAQIRNGDKGKHPWEASAGCQVVRPGNPGIWDSSRTSLREAWLFYSLQICEFWANQQIDSSIFCRTHGASTAGWLKSQINEFPTDPRH